MMGSKYDDVEVSGRDREFVTVLKHQAVRQEGIERRLDGTDRSSEDAIAATEALLGRLARPLPTRPATRQQPPDGSQMPAARPWHDIVAEAQASVSGPVGMADLLTEEEISNVESRIELLRGEFDATHRLDAIDWAIAGVSGTLAALVDAFLIKMPSSPGFLGGPRVEGGQLSDFIRGRLKTVFTPEQIAELEQAFPVPYDAAISRGLKTPVGGLCPRTHRFQSLGHDPVLGFIIGTADILWGTMTAVDSSGTLIRQATDCSPVGMSLFEAVVRQLGHLASDVGTPAGLPAPLMPLVQFVRVGNVGKEGRTIGDLSRLMYAKGYDFGHFLAMSLVPMLIEVLVRGCYAVKRLVEGQSLLDCIPMSLPGRPPPPKLHTMLFTAHLIATAANAGRVCLGPVFNPLAVNYPEWIAFFKYAVGQLKWALWDREQARLSHVQSRVDADWGTLNRNLEGLWARTELSAGVPTIA